MVPYEVYNKIDIGLVTIPAWWLFFGLAYLVPIFLVWRETKRKKMALANKMINLGILIFIGSIIGGRLGYVLQFPQYYFFHFSEIFKVWQGGLTFFGGMAGATLISWLYIKKEKANFWEIADLGAGVVGLGIFIARIGCSLINDHQGAITSLPWGILWPDGNLRHPVAGYLALNGVLIFIVLRFLKKRYDLKNIAPKPGQFFLIFLLWYPLSRFFLDFTRARDTPLADPHFQGLNNSQWISLGILLSILAGYLGYFLALRKNNRKF